MASYKEDIQYTFRVIGTPYQFIATTDSEAKAREEVARFYLTKIGEGPGSPDFEERVREVAKQGLRLVFMR
ncbi:MAG: hypothetical protein AAGA10_29010, partial [Bacteroidota bacterium]